MEEKEINEWLSDLYQTVIGQKLTNKNSTKEYVADVLDYLNNIIIFLPGCVYWKDINGVYRSSNNSLAKIAGLKSRMDIIGTTDYDLPWKDEASSIRKNDLQVMASNKTLEFEEPMTSVNGNLIIMLTKKAPLKDQNGNIIGILGIALDISNRKEKENREKETVEITLNNIVANMPGHIYWKNKEGVYLGCNNRQAESLGMSYGSEVVGKTDFELPWEKGVAKVFRENDIKIMETGQTLIMEERSQMDGKDSIVLSQKAPFKDSNDQIIGILGISIDITDRKTFLKNLENEKIKAEKRADSNQENLERIIACLPGSVYWKDTQGVYLGCNDEMANLMGLPKSSIIGKTDFDFAEIFGSLTVAETFRNADKEVINSGVPNLNIEEPPFHFADGKIIYQLSNRVPLLGENNKIEGIIGISIDITEQKKMEVRLREALIAADVANRAKSEFLRNMEHQLRTPFSGVYSLVSIAAAQESNPEYKELLEITHRSGQELLSLVNDIINFSRNEVDNSIVLDKKFDLKQLIEKAVILEKPAAIDKQLQLSYSYPEKLPTIFISDPKRIQRLVLHLLSNAIKFTSIGSIKVEVTLGKQIDDKTYVIQIWVTDTGIGISEENQAFIYERFYRVSPANQNKYAGAGLGLSTVKRLINDLNGEIDVISELGQGTTFVCTLSLKRPLMDEIINKETSEKKYSLFLHKKE